MLAPGDVVSYLDMCAPFGVNLQRGMNFRLRNGESLILMSVRPGAPYEDRVEQGGKVIVYEGHDIPRTRLGPDPKSEDQPEFQPNGRPTQNGLFIAAVAQYKSGTALPERVRVFEKIRDGIWVYNGLFSLIDGWKQSIGGRKVFRFKLQVLDEDAKSVLVSSDEPGHDRVIPTAVKLEVWKRDKGACAKCGSKQNLHFDHMIPYSQGGSSKDSKNIQILCAKHNLEKKDRIE
jgi:HNH endonuclease